MFQEEEIHEEIKALSSSPLSVGKDELKYLPGLGTQDIGELRENEEVENIINIIIASIEALCPGMNPKLILKEVSEDREAFLFLLVEIKLLKKLN